MYTVLRTKDKTLKWHVLKSESGKLVRRCHTKRQAQLVAAVLDGDISAAPALYREDLKHNLRRVSSREDALRGAMLSASIMGLGPKEVKVDPTTGEPLDLP